MIQVIAYDIFTCPASRDSPGGRALFDHLLPHKRISCRKEQGSCTRPSIKVILNAMRSTDVSRRYPSCGDLREKACRPNFHSDLSSLYICASSMVPWETANS